MHLMSHDRGQGTSCITIKEFLIILAVTVTKLWKMIYLTPLATTADHDGADERLNKTGHIFCFSFFIIASHISK